MQKLLVVLGSTIFVLFACSSAQENKALFEAKCIQCHSLEKSLNATKNLQEWKRTVDAMVRYAEGAISKKDADKIVKYLVERPKG
jgi:hypothetical protein